MDSETEDFEEHDDVLVTGQIVSEPGKPYVYKLKAQIATTHTKDSEDYDYFKVWPHDENDPQLPKYHDGKLWFRRSTSFVHVTIKEPDFQEFLKQQSEWIPTWGTAKRLSAAALVTAIVLYLMFCFLFTSIFLFFKYGN